MWMVRRVNFTQIARAIYAGNRRMADVVFVADSMQTEATVWIQARSAVLILSVFCPVLFSRISCSDLTAVHTLRTGETVFRSAPLHLLKRTVKAHQSITVDMLAVKERDADVKRAVLTCPPTFSKSRSGRKAGRGRL